MSGSLFSASAVIPTSATIDRLSIDLVLVLLLPSTNSLPLFIFYPEDEIVVLLVLIPRPVKRSPITLGFRKLWKIRSSCGFADINLVENQWLFTLIVRGCAARLCCEVKQ